jgi:hypothetical protein
MGGRVGFTRSGEQPQTIRLKEPAMITTSALTAMVRQSLSTEELAKVEELIAEYGQDYDSITDVIQDARAMLA